jgi:hypothetical protein
MKIRTFDTGATRDTEKGKLDFEGFLSPIVLHRYAQYLEGHRTQSDGTLRDSDNWQKGIAKTVYAKSGLRHQIDVWMLHRGYHLYRERSDVGETTHIRTEAISSIPAGWTEVTMEDALCACIFNNMGYLFELLKVK